MTCPQVVRLTADGVSELTIDMDGTEGLFLIDLDLGYPTPREVIEDLTEQDGTDDSTRYFGARVVTLRTIAIATAGLTRQQVLDRLAAFTVPNLRPILSYVLEEDGDERRIVIRGSQRSAPLTAPWWDDMQDVQVSWVGPSGVIESSVEHVVVVFAGGDTEAGRTYDLTFDRVYPSSTPVGATYVTNAGNVTAPLVMRLYGPVTNPRIGNETTGEVLEFDDLTIPEGEYVEIDTAASTILLNGDPALSRFDRVNWAVSTLWQLPPGTSVVRYYPETFTVPAQAELRYHDAYI